MNDNPIFIIGPRRGGTTILRELVQMSPDCGTILFEPHELWFAIYVAEIRRYEKVPEVQSILKRFNELPRNSGAKFAFNASTEAFDIHKIPMRFPKARYVFIVRHLSDVYSSLFKLDNKTERGVVSTKAHYDITMAMYRKWAKFVNIHGGVILEFEHLVTQPLDAMMPVYDYLEFRPPKMERLTKKVRRPNNCVGVEIYERLT